MKFNGTKNIVTDKDITITGASHLGDTLSEILESQQEDISKLKSNVKWLYKYGGVGSGKGGGGGSDTSWTLYASLGGKRIENENVISLDPNVDTYRLTIRVAGGSSSYSGTYQCGKAYGRVILDASNGWTQEIPLNLTSNGDVSVTISDNIDIKNCSATYIVKPYEFKQITFVKGYIDEDGKPIIGDRYNPGASDSDLETIFIENAVKDGLLAVSEYSISVEADASYKFTSSISDNDVESDITESYGHIVYEIIKKGDDSWTGEHAGTYNLDLEIKINTTELNTILLNKSFSLIPNSLYLQVSTGNKGEMFYDAPITDGSSFYKYKTNQKAIFKLFTYEGSDNKSDVIFEYKSKLYGTDTWNTFNPITAKERQTKEVSFVFLEEGWYELAFTVTCNGNVDTVTKYIYCYEFISDYKWYKTRKNGTLESSGATIGKSAYLRLNESNISGLNSSILMNTSKDDISYSFDLESNDASDFLINLGIRYNNINNTNNPIVELYTTSYKTGPAILIYQNKIIVNGLYDSKKEIPIFLKKDSNYEEGVFGTDSGLKSKLISIGLFKVYTAGTQDYRYQLCVYVDGILEGSVQDFTSATSIFNKVVFKSGNYCVNLFDITYANAENAAFNDADVNYYFDTYYEKTTSSSIAEEEKELLFRLFDESAGATYSIENDLIKLKSGIVESIAEYSKVPTLVLSRNREYISQQENIDVVKWLNDSYSDINSGRLSYQMDVDVKWSNGKSALKNINISSEFGQNSKFFIKIQGSSTKTLKSKNLTLGLKTDPDLSSSGRTVLFSPNYQKSNYKSFLPEQEFTLKADVVDSSHSNNTSIGAYINTYNTFDYDKSQSGVDEDILKHTKQCLEGFPILLFLDLKNENGESDIYYLGVYNFNLGRGSYFNLAYPKLNQLENLNDANIAGNEFTFISVEDLDVLSGFVAAEVQDNLKYWDFSQWDNSILFAKPDDTTGYMFDDIVYSNTNTSARASIQNFVKKIARGGGYLFQEIGKNFEELNENPSDNSTQYAHIGYVPDFKTQYKRTTIGATNFKKIEKTDFKSDDEWLEFQKSVDKAQLIDLNECIVNPEDITEYTPILNYDSALYYYTTCMVFGLVDSVQKNLNIKTWDNNKFGLFFYDMDTSLGIDNGGENTSYFAFSDYWKTKMEDLEEEDEDGYRIINNNGTIVHRDYRPSMEPGEEAGYDIPISYLLAIPKYTDVVLGENKFTSPQTLYATWRQIGGPLENADKFIDGFFAKNLKDVPKCMLNLNYRCKYLYKTSGENHSADSLKLKGTRIEKTRDWFESRLRILDAYFNINGYSFPIFVEDDDYINGTIDAKSTLYKESIPFNISISENSDIYITRDIFKESNDDQGKRNGRVSQIINADNNSPLIILNGSIYNRYLLKDSNVKYRITQDFNNTNSLFGGSRLWRMLDGIDTFADTLNSKSFYLNSDRLREIVGTSGTTNNIKLESPSAESIKLNSPNYSGELKIGNEFYSLKDVDISKSKISLNLDGSSSVKTVNINNVKSNEITIINNYNLSDLKMNNVTIDTFTASSLPYDDVSIGSGHLIKSVILTGKDAGTLSINSNVTQNVTFGKYEKINITGNKINSIICNDGGDSVLTSVSIINCPELKTLTLSADNITTINLSGCSSLETLTLKGSQIESFDKLKSLDVSGTKITSIKFETFDGEYELTEQYLDLTKFPNLSKTASDIFNIGNNSSVVNIQFTNDKDRPVLLNNNFTGCTKLERIYGNVSVNYGWCFNGCKQFSIHGNINSVKWQNKNVVDNGRVLMPYEVLGKDYKDITNDDLFQSGLGVTNLSMQISNASGLFYNTSCSIFDIYYFFSNCTNITQASDTFAYLSNRDGYSFFNWEDGKNYNNPNRYLFYRSNKITYLNECFRINVPNISVKLYSPSINDNGEVVEDNGLFSPLTELIDASYIFIGYNYYADRYLFRRKNGNYPIVNLRGFNPRLIVDNVNDLGNSHPTLDISNIDMISKCGNLTDFFKNINGKITEIGIMFNTLMVDYDTITLPATVIDVRRAFVTSYATGEINLNKIFTNKSIVKNIRNSFVVSNSFDNYKATFYLNNNTFNGFNSIVEIGYGDTGDYQNTDISKSSFCGNGISKIINEPGGFPYNIFKNSKSWTVINCIFKDAIPENPYSDVKLPGDMFDDMFKLNNISGLFYNIAQEFSLSDGRCFESCKDLQNVSYLFAQDDLAIKPRLTGSIPLEFFYHGESPETSLNLPQYWANEYEDKTTTNEETGEEITTREYKLFDIGDNRLLKKRNVYSTITDMSYCFKHSDLDVYVNNSPSYEVNTDYYPGLYWSNSNSATEGWNKGSKTVNEYPYTEIWVYDGMNRTSKSDCENLDNVNFDDEGFKYDYIKPNTDIANMSASGNYCAPPDLLRYCTSDCKIEGLFMNSGLIGWRSRYSNGFKIHEFGLKGRLCPYMLKPVRNTKNIDNLFKGCKSLSYYIDETNTSYMIPKNFFDYTPNIESMKNTFSEMLFPENVDIKVFDKLKKTLDICEIFYRSYWDGKEDNPVKISEVFRENEISNCIRAFCPSMYDETLTQYDYKQYVWFNYVFKDKYGKSSYANNKNYAYTFCGYDSNTVQHEDPKTLVDNTVTRNYTNHSDS